MSSHPAIEFNQHNTPSVQAGSPVLQHCSECATVQYPSRELCRNCLSASLEWKPLENSSARVLTYTQLHNSLEEFYMGRLPWDLVSVQLDIQPLGTLLVHSSSKHKPGDSVQLNVVQDHSGSAALLAVAEDEDARALWQKMSQDSNQ